MSRRYGLFAHALREIGARRGPAAGVAAAVIVGVTGFTLLTTSADAQRLETVGTVQDASQQTFDLLVRPRGSRLEVERKERLVQPGYLNGLAGISFDQLDQVRSTPGVAVAAPVAMLGYFSPWMEVPVDLTRNASRVHPSTFRVDATWMLPDGSVLNAEPQFTVMTPAALGVAGAPILGDTCGPGDPAALPRGTTVTSRRNHYSCHTRREFVDSSGRLPAGHVADWVMVPIPMLIAAIDPEAEAQLLPLESAVTGAEALDRLAAPVSSRSREVPALLSSTSPVDFSLDVDATQLRDETARTILAGKGLSAGAARTGRRLFSQHTTAAEQYAFASHVLETFVPKTYYRGGVWQYWSTSGLRLRQVGSGLTAVPVANDLTQLWVDPSDFSVAPVATNDVGFRTITLHRRYPARGEGLPDPPAIVNVGTFDPSLLTSGIDDVSRILAGYGVAPTRDEAGRPVGASPNIASVVQAPPTVLVNLASMRRLVDGWSPTTSLAPISAVRVKVVGVSGVDAVSRERVRLAAQRIREATGLDVDITVGSSTTMREIDVPAGRFGRSQQTLRQDWVRLGVATQVLRALDKKSLLLFVLVLLVASLTTANSVIASVRSRRSEIGVLACLGWGRGTILRSLMTELMVVAAGAGAVAFVASLGLARVGGLDLSTGRAAVALPAALVVVLVAGLVPAVRATRISPLEAVHPAVTGPRRVATVRSAVGLAWTNVRRVRARSALAVGALALATATFTLLLAIAVGFRGAVVGSVLGDAVAVEARGADYAAAVATLVLAGIGMANLTYLNIRDRSVELATLLSLGWSARRTRGLLATEAAVLGVVGGVLGAGAGYLVAWLLFGTLPVLVVVAAVAAAVLALVIALFAAWATASRLDRLPLTLLLTE